MKNRGIVYGFILAGCVIAGFFAGKWSSAPSDAVSGAMGGGTEHLLIVTLLDRDLTPAGKTPAEFDSLHRLYVEKVIAKNNLILSHKIQKHGWAATQDQLALMVEVRDIDDLYLANLMNDSLFQIGWPALEDREQFTAAYDKYFVGKRTGEFETEPSL